MLDTALSLMVLATIALLIGALVLWRRGGARKQAVMMALLALILGVNVAIWVLPTASGDNLAQQH